MISVSENSTVNIIIAMDCRMSRLYKIFFDHPLAQASSSSRAAQLLQNKNVSITPSLGFCKEGAEAAATSVDSTLSSSFRKLSKKETVTKQKVSLSTPPIVHCLLIT